ncbi:hypothetical protein LCGC14_0308550 [marine sediment metagenome]|uniref:Apea-like HEPN domain-containing protein n=1 Tax=marine sediment metagenome TaxID=412755 RepID=A0A0F9TT92_9ZZZZ|tara:strand:+ start:356 stop:886 length:531 start_codon:yes stop_codon:yes gene_type:complete
MAKRYKEYTDTEKEFYFYIGLLSDRFAKMEVLVRDILGAFISDDDVLNAYLFEKNSLDANIKLIKTINIKYDYEKKILTGILNEVSYIKSERNSFIHGIWSEPIVKDNDIIIHCSNPKMKFEKEPNGKRWSFGHGKSVRLTFIKKLVGRIDDIMISQKAFIERLQNFDLEFWMPKG